MNEKLLYTLDPYIVSLLFKPESDEKALEIYQELNEGVNTVLKETIKEYLKENKFSDEDIEKVINTEDFSTLDSKFSPYLQNIILFNRVDDNTKTYLKLFYDQVLPNISEEDKKSLNDYLAANEEAINEQKAVTMEGLQLMKDILVENGVSSYEELKEKLEKEGVNVNIPSETPINLGGSSTNPSVEPMVAPIEEVKEESIAPQNIELPEQTINSIPVEDANQEMSPLVDMALNSTINNFQQSESVNQDNTPAQVEQVQVAEPVNDLNNIPVEAPVEPNVNEEIKFTPMAEVEQVQQVQQEPVQEPVLETQATEPQTLEFQTPEAPVPNQEVPAFNAVQTVSPMNFINPVQQEIPAPPMPDQNAGLPEIQAMPENVITEPIAEPLSDIQPIQMDQQLPQIGQAEPQLSAINKLDGLGINLDNPVSDTQQ